MGKSSSDGRARYRNRSSVVELVGRDRLLFTRVEIGVTQIFAEKQMQNFGLKISTSYSRNSHFSSPEFSFFGRSRATVSGGGGGITSKLANQYPSWGTYKHAPTAIWRKRRLLYIANKSKRDQTYCFLDEASCSLYYYTRNSYPPTSFYCISCSTHHLYCSCRRSVRYDFASS